MRIAEQGKLSVVSLQLSVECLAATRRGAWGNCGMRISDCGMESDGHDPHATSHQPPVTRKLRRQTKPTRRKALESTMLASSLPQMERRGAA